MRAAPDKKKNQIRGRRWKHPPSKTSTGSKIIAFMLGGRLKVFQIIDFSSAFFFAFAESHLQMFI